MRKLTTDERRLWDFVTRSVTPLKSRHLSENQDAGADCAPPAPSSRRPASAQGAAEARPTHRATHHKPLHLGHLVDLDASMAKTFRKGRMPSDGRLDLHGLTLAQAHSALVYFVRHKAERGARCLLVITGKGATNPNADIPRGRIKAELMHWLNAAPLRQLILAVTEANKNQSNSGAVYILLKRRDKTRI